MNAAVGDWELKEELGQGGMGVVYAAHHCLIEGDFAIKMLRPELAHDPSVLKRFLAEVQKARLLDHPNIVRMEIPFKSGDAIYLPMELLRGRPLSEQLAREPGAWPVDRTVDIMIQAAAGLGHAHSQEILHRDVKPENLFITNTGRVKLLDFGLAKRIGDATLTGHGMAVGTPVYMAPEILRGKPPVAASDLYSLGVIMFRMLTGQLPIPIQNTAATLAELFGPVLHAHEKGLPRPSEVKAGLPDWIDDLSAQLLDQDPLKRPQHGAALARILEGFPLSASIDLPQMPTSGLTPVPIPMTATPISVPAAPSPSATEIADSSPHLATSLSQPPLTRQNAPMFVGLALGLVLVGVGAAFMIDRGATARPTAVPETAMTPEGVLVTFSSDPPGALVMVEGKPICRGTPCSHHFPKGHRYVTMRLDRYRTYGGVFDVADQPVGVHARLVSTFGQVQFVSAIAGLTIALDGKVVGKTPVGATELKAGEHVVEVRDPRFARVPVRFVVRGGATRTLTIKPVPVKVEDPRGAEFDEFFELDVPKPRAPDPSFDLEP